MSNKPSLTFYTNIPTPYQRSFFNELSKLFTLKVIYYSVTESNRNWNYEMQEHYETIILKDNFIARMFQQWVSDFHFSWQIFSVAWKDNSKYVIVGGSYATANATVALLMSKLKGKKVAYFSEPLFEVHNFFKHAIKWLYLRIVSICCHAIFCIGKKAAESFNSYQIVAAKFVILYNIDEKTFINYDPLKLAGYSERYKGNNDLIVLSSGTLTHRKGMDILIKAVKMIPDQNVKLIIIGSGPALEELVALRDNDERIMFEGFQHPDELPYYFAIADVFAFASRYDGWAVVINEAIAANVPIVSSKNVGASSELITSDKLGILCESGNVNKFKEAIEFLLFNPYERRNIKQNASRLIPLISSSYNAKLVYDAFINHMQ